MPRCQRHPDTEVLKGHDYCFLDQNGGSSIEHDRIGNDYEVMSQHVKPGITGITTRRKYQQLLKREGLTDDVTHKEIVHCTLDSGKRDKVREQGIASIVDSMTDRMRHVRDVPVHTDSQRQLRKNLVQWMR